MKNGRTMTDPELRELVKLCIHRAYDKQPTIFRQLFERLSTSQIVSVVLDLGRPHDNLDFRRICEMAKAGEFDVFFQDLLTVSQN